MKREKTISGFGFILLMIFGLLSNQLFTQTLNPPENLTYQVVDENDVTLTWNPPALGDPIYLHWDDGINSTGYGFGISAETWDAAAKWDPAQIATYDGWSITKMRFYMTGANTNLTMKIWTGPDATLQYSEAVSSYSTNAWTEIDFTTPYEIDASTELWAGLEIAQTTSGYPMGMDAGPAVGGYGNMMYFGGSWTQIGSGNWNIQILIEPSKKGNVTELLGYNVYRDDQQINTTTISAPSFIDMNLFNGTYDYYVTALYDAGESDSSNHVEVLIDQPVILYSDSMALVDLYNSCNGSNWSIDDFWLLGPVSEWFGITTQGTRVTSVSLNMNQVSGEIPDSFCSLDSLETLWLAGNYITSLPDSIGNLSSLTELLININQITSIPESFGDLVNLEEINLSYNQISTLPETFGNLTSLRWLGLGYGEFDSLPSTFGNLSALETCFLIDNNLSSLPENFGDLSSIDYLTMSENNLTVLPESFGNMSTLRVLYAENNQLTELPSNFSNIASLEMLFLYGNQITTLPEDFGNLSALGYVDIAYNQLTKLPESFGNTDPDTLLLYNNQIQEIPESMYNNTFDFLWIENNLLQFGSLEPFVGTADFTYTPQGLIGEDTTITIEVGSTLEYAIEVTGEFNQYQWYKDGTLLSGQNSDTLYIEDISAADEGAYMLEVTNTLATGLTLQSYNIILTTTTVGFEDNEVSEFTLYPNPVNGDQIVIDFKNPTSVKLINVYNSMGQIIEQINNPYQQQTLDVTHLSPGIYYVKFTNGKQVKATKFIRN